MANTQTNYESHENLNLNEKQGFDSNIQQMHIDSSISLGDEEK